MTIAEWRKLERAILTISELRLGLPRHGVIDQKLAEAENALREIKKMQSQ